MRLNIKILGTGCPNCLTLEKKVRRFIEQHGIDAEITMVKDIMDIMAYHVMSTPSLVVNEQVVARGRVPSDKELLKFFTQ